MESDCRPLVLYDYFLQRVDEVYDALNMQGNDGFLPFVGFEEGEVGMGIHEEVLRECCGADGVFKDVERGLEIWVTIGPVGANFTSGEVSLGSVVEAVGQLVRKGVPVIGVRCTSRWLCTSGRLCLRH